MPSAIIQSLTDTEGRDLTYYEMNPAAMIQTEA